MLDSWGSYPSIYSLGHRYVADILKDPVLVEEKVDGSQFSFGLFQGDNGPYLRCRSKGAELNIVAPEKMFQKGIEHVQSIQHLLQVGWTYRGEYLQKPKHNTLAYERIPNGHVILFDINTGIETYLDPVQKLQEANRIGLEVVPVLAAGLIESESTFRRCLDTVSCLGGQKIEGVVIKNYARFGVDKKVLLGKFVSEAFKETHSKEWKATNPTKNDIVEQLVQTLKTDARWHKAVQHLRERGELTDSPEDIGKLLKEVAIDVEKEEMNLIQTKLVEWAWPHIKRGITRRLPEWYKEQLLKLQFERSM